MSDDYDEEWTPIPPCDREHPEYARDEIGLVEHCPNCGRHLPLAEYRRRYCAACGGDNLMGHPDIEGCSCGSFWRKFDEPYNMF